MKKIPFVFLDGITMFILVLLTVSSLPLQADTVKEPKISIAMEGVPVIEVMNEVEQQSHLTFFYNSRQINTSRLVDIYLNDVSLNHVLDYLFASAGITYRYAGKQIVLAREMLSPVKMRDGPDRLRISRAGSSPARKTEYFPVLKPIGQMRQLTVTGKVTDADSGEGLPGVNVVLKGAETGTVTDMDGNYSITLSGPGTGVTLVFSFLGYISQELPVAGKEVMDVSLKKDVVGLEEVVVVGYGEQKKVNLTGAVSTLDGEDLARRQVAQSSMLLQGVAPGLVVTQRNGQPGNDQGTISIRGKTTLGNNDPLILVDGVEMGLNNIDPAMIESISVLKDAASASIYGSRAAGGVILVTTKRATEKGMTVSYNMYVGQQRATALPDMVGAIDHMLMTNEAYVNTGQSPLYSEESIAEYRENMAADPDQYPDTDWYDQVLSSSGIMQSHFLTFSGGGDVAKVTASLGYLDQQGLTPNTDFKRYTLRVNSDLNLAEGLTAQLDAHIKQVKATEPSRGTSAAIHWAGRIPANQVSRLSNGLWGEGWNGDNPVAFTRDGGLRLEEAPSVTLNLGLNYKPADWVDLKLVYAPNYWQSNNSVFRKAIQTYKWDGSPSFLTPQMSSQTTNHTRNLNNNLRATATFNKSWAEHNFTLLAGFQQEDFRQDDLEGYREIYAFPDYPVLDAGGEENQKAYGGAEEWALRSFFGRLNYNYKERYLFESNFRYDGSSRFVNGRKWGLFPSFSVGWRISEENFFDGARNVVDNLKLRASWGQLGNQNIGTYPFSTYVNLDQKYVLEGQVQNGAAITSLANPAISWETTTASNIGLDVSLFGKLSLVGEYFYKVTEDVLLDLDIPLIVGMAKPYQNAGKVENRGWELGVNYSEWTGEFKYEIGFNLSDVKNKVLDLKGVARSGVTVNHEGHAMFSIFGLESAGFITEADFDADGGYLHADQGANVAPGDIRYLDQNGDGLINTDDYTIIGGTIPRLTFGLNFNSRYKNFDLSFFIQGVGKADGLLRDQGIMPFFLGGTVQEQHKDHWRPDNRDALFPRLAFNETNNEKISSFWMRSAAYARLKNVQLGYTLPQDVLTRMGISQLRIYFSGQNLFTIDDFWDGFDVEAPVGNGGYYPQVKTYSIGLDFRL